MYDLMHTDKVAVTGRDFPASTTEELFIAHLRGSEDGDTRGPLNLQGFPQCRRGFLDGFLPADLLPAVALAQPRRPQAVGGVDSRIGVTPFVAHPVAVHVRVETWFQARHAFVVITWIEVLVNVDFNIASATASRADGRSARQKPYAALEPEVPVGQGSHRADVHDVT